MGGGEVARYLGTYGDARIRSAVLAAAVPPYLLKTDDNPDGGLADDDVQGMIDGVTVGPRRASSTSSRPTSSPSTASSRSPRTSASRRSRSRSRRADAALAGCIAAFGRTDFRDDLAKIAVPTLVIHGDGDATVPFEVSGKRSAEAISDSDAGRRRRRSARSQRQPPRRVQYAALLDFLER